MNAKQLAKELGVTTAAISQHYKKYKNKLNGHVSRNKGELNFDKLANKILKDSFNTKYQNKKNKAKTKSLQLQTFKLLKEQLNRKDQQIKDLGQQLNQAQALQRQTQNELDISQNQLKLANKKDTHGKIWNFFHSL